MITLLEAVAQTIWRASWQAALLALVVALVLVCAGQRLAPRWRFLLWGVVLARLLVAATPGSPWSAFNLVAGSPNSEALAFAQQTADGEVAPVAQRLSPAPIPYETAVNSPRDVDAASKFPVAAEKASTRPINEASSPPASVMTPTPPISRLFAAFNARLLSSLWLAGCLFFGLKLAATAIVLRRRLSACRPVADANVLGILEACRRRLGLKRTPRLFVTPGRLGPCVVCAWNPKIVLPESVVTDSTASQLRHVLAHELAHLVRGDLWTNWLLLAARVVHWFNPAAWWTVRQMQVEREAACDDLAFGALNESERRAYAATIVELASRLGRSAFAPGLVGLFTSTCRVKARVERLLRSPSVKTLRAPAAGGLLLALALTGLTDAMPDAGAQAPQEAASAPGETPEATPTYSVGGQCIEDADRRPLAGITVRLYRLEGRTSPPAAIAETTSNAEGHYAFSGLAPPRREHHLDRLAYGVLGFAEDRPIGISFFHFADGKEVVELHMTREKSTLAGRVVDDAGRPVAGATVVPYFVYDRPAPDVLSTTTDAEGRFKLDNLGVYKWPGGQAVPTRFAVMHADYPETSGTAEALPADVVVTLPKGCRVTGTVTDGVAGRPAAGALITAQRVDQWGEIVASTDADGQFRLVAPEGRYDFLVHAKDRVCVAATGRECLAGEGVGLPPFTLIEGGFISGEVVDASTGEPVSVAENGEPIVLGLIGPSQPVGRAISPARMAEVDKAGRFTLRAAPGENFPYFVNTRGVRMAWDTRDQPPVVVNEGETTAYDMLITPPVPPEEKLRAARRVVESLPAAPSDRAASILEEFRTLNHTVDEPELWCMLMRELVAIGPAAVPRLCDELDGATENKMLRRLGFALRAIGDPRAIPALIRAIPRTLLPGSSDYGLLVADKDLTSFMQTHDLDQGRRGEYFSFGRPVREIFGALAALSGQNLDDADLFSMSLSEDPRRQVLQRRVYNRQAERWQTWWEANWRAFTDDAAYQKCNLNLGEEPLPPAVKSLGPQARVSGVWTGAVLSPALQGGEHAWHFYDLDAGYRPRWPAHIPRDAAARNPALLAEWAAELGVDLMCVAQLLPDGTETYALQALGMTVREIDARDLRNLDRLIAAGTIPEGRPVGELLIHYDAASRQLAPDANAAFFFVTRQGCMGVIETTDRVTRTADLTGMAGNPPAGVGFHKGVRFNLKEIIP